MIVAPPLQPERSHVTLPGLVLEPFIGVGVSNGYLCTCTCLRCLCMSGCAHDPSGKHCCVNLLPITTRVGERASGPRGIQTGFLCPPAFMIACHANESRFKKQIDTGTENCGEHGH